MTSGARDPTQSNLNNCCAAVALSEQTSAFGILPGNARLQGIADGVSSCWLKPGASAIHTKTTNANPTKQAGSQGRASTRGRLSKLEPARKGLNQRHVALAIGQRTEAPVGRDEHIHCHVPCAAARFSTHHRSLPQARMAALSKAFRNRHGPELAGRRRMVASTPDIRTQEATSGSSVTTNWHPLLEFR